MLQRKQIRRMHQHNANANDADTISLFGDVIDNEDIDLEDMEDGDYDNASL